MKRIVFNSGCVLPDSDYSVEQSYFTITDILNGNIPNSSPSLDYSQDDDDDDDDEWDSKCRDIANADSFYDEELAKDFLDKEKEREVRNGTPE